MNLPNSRDSLEKAVLAGGTFDFVYFWGHRKPEDGSVTKSCLSQWYEARFRVGDEVFRTAEHYMMVRKARLFGDDEAARAILRAGSANEAKKLGRAVRGFSESTWLQCREEIVYDGNRAKFSQNSSLRAFLLTTRGAILVEASPVDLIWGIGLSQEDPRAKDVSSWPGLNLLGFALTRVREDLERGR